MLAALSQLAQSTYMYSSDYSSGSSNVSAGVGIGIFLGVLVFGIIIYVLVALCLVKLFKKAGRQDSWAGWIPVYNTWVLYEIAGKPGWWSVLGLIPFVGPMIALVLGIIVYIELAKAFGKSGGFAALLILLPVIGFPMLAFGSAEYSAPSGVAATSAGPQHAAATVNIAQPGVSQPAPVASPPVQPPVDSDGGTSGTQPPVGPIAQ